VAIVCDLVEEAWPSMDLVGEMLIKHLSESAGAAVRATRLCPPMKRRLTRLGPFGAGRLAFNLDRVANRLWDYPRWLRRRRADFDVFHVIDHSYSQLVHQLPAERTVVTCHDLDTFRAVLQPETERRSRPFRAMVRHTLSGFRSAARVTCPSAAIREEIVAGGLLPPERVVVVPNGVHPACCPEPEPVADAVVRDLLGHSVGAPELLHVGSTIPRKRIDVLLRVFAGVRRGLPGARLVRVGGEFTPKQERLVRTLGLESSIVVLPFLGREVLAAVYRRAALVLQPSEREGFGLPVAEAMACGTPVVASDLPVLREVGGRAAAYCEVADVYAWMETVVDLLDERDRSPKRWAARKVAGSTQAARFTWAEYARRMVEVYRDVLEQAWSS
jgi:glycosyltransferase involved in cell wall biosynthesis